MSGACAAGVAQYGSWRVADENACDSANDGMPSTAASFAAATVPEYSTSSAALRPRLTPDSTRSGMSFMMWRAPMMTQSVGVPFTA